MAADYEESLHNARIQYDAAFHLLNVTYPLINDPKLLPGILTNIFLSLEASMDAILQFERQLKLVPIYNNNFQSKFNMFRYKPVRRHKISQTYIDLIQNLKEMLDLHKKSPMEFQRGNKFVMCDKNYRIQSISTKDIREYCTLTKEFIDTINTIINRKA
ncbi:hypothetical protein HOL21_04075 [Candidatus Woesearchaeota archaeon]|jgi:hypothetical protein|nr:hypothetical protein [Candidatus Woesearchaeota archaeon]MBT5397363.1 hypothetical protein [Candidatus Woesearchaeota archaeon]MBT5924743.1 hypothetical protein [Candidatus Woesearchaeota archaeon]MBT7762763.1 hypothetical protein [Candidatus Woesearchaeota archaeon]